MESTQQTIQAPVPPAMFLTLAGLLGCYGAPPEPVGGSVHSMEDGDRRPDATRRLDDEPIAVVRARESSYRTPEQNKMVLSRMHQLQRQRTERLYRAAMLGQGIMTTSQIRENVGRKQSPRKPLIGLCERGLVQRHGLGQWEWIGETNTTTIEQS